jgi:hypothetical protein
MKASRTFLIGSFILLCILFHTRPKPLYAQPPVAPDQRIAVYSCDKRGEIEVCAVYDPTTELHGILTQNGNSVSVAMEVK